MARSAARVLRGLGLGLGVGAGAALHHAHPARADGTWRWPTQPPPPSPSAAGGSGSIVDAVGNTPLVELRSLSAATGCRILAKAEYMNPGGSIKDRAALWLINEAERSGQLRPGGTICEGTGGNTGIGLALIANAKGYKCIFAMGRGIAKEKIEMMKTFGAEVILTPPAPFTSPEHCASPRPPLPSPRQSLCQPRASAVCLCRGRRLPPRGKGGARWQPRRPWLTLLHQPVREPLLLPGAL